MYVIGHNNIQGNFRIRVMGCYHFYLSDSIIPHFRIIHDVIFDMTENMDMIVGTDCNKIHSGIIRMPLGTPRINPIGVLE